MHWLSSATPAILVAEEGTQNSCFSLALQGFRPALLRSIADNSNGGHGHGAYTRGYGDPQVTWCPMGCRELSCGGRVRHRRHGDQR